MGFKVPSNLSCSMIPWSSVLLGMLKVSVRFTKDGSALLTLLWLFPMWKKKFRSRIQWSLRIPFNSGYSMILVLHSTQEQHEGEFSEFHDCWKWLRQICITECRNNLCPSTLFPGLSYGYFDIYGLEWQLMCPRLGGKGFFLFFVYEEDSGLQSFPK